MRTQEEILKWARREIEKPTDLFGAKATDLLELLDFEHAKEFLKEGTTEEVWKQHWISDEAGIRDSAGKYFPFALEKAGSHRGLSADRATQHFAVWVWVIGTDEQYASYVDTDYSQYGVPKIIKAAEVFGVREELDSLLDDELRRMATGLPCTPECMEGCGR
ncbi:hypothetical protein BJD78_gp73 [Arthrobacter phage KellEzio]|uniref:Uncharacterized protein n=1 Tax=Arthrobacter phage KellEzio TaxID=1796995 RepID=A0A140G6F8_9CAUD|nr:hypothetical protein BJD78_gp73 [Arthrobacter phage KellEzio]AMM44243.1 hypothetical protein KELLEZIO_73 [Arthrobacter phage KellEzio]